MINNKSIKLITNKTDSGKRIDQFISQNTELSRQRISKLIQDGYVSVNEEVISIKKNKIRGDIEKIKIILPELIEDTLKPENISLNILYEDDYILVIDKQSDLVVHPGAGNKTGTLVNAILHHCGKSLSGIGGHIRPGIVHRLDKNTSGLMIIAKNDLAHNNLSKQFMDHGRNGDLERIYDALVWGIPKIGSGKIETQIRRNDRDKTKMMTTKSMKNSKLAITTYKVIEKIYNHKNDPLISQIRCKLYTGRTHQIRVHLDYIGHPVICDQKYGKGFNTKLKLLSNNCRNQLKIDRHALHSSKLSFRHPIGNKPMTFESELPDDLKLLKNMLSGI
ncbi:RluA family pseudouridine synthase [Gammaproteobacteria bacterium]|nr:RluA family pseudouridine synthase [Gammaproteobacteria bacterium]